MARQVSGRRDATYNLPSITFITSYAVVLLLPLVHLDHVATAFGVTLNMILDDEEEGTAFNHLYNLIHNLDLFLSIS